MGGHQRKVSKAVEKRRQRKRQWPRILKRFGYACAYCRAANVPLTKDHLVPRLRGGSSQGYNIVPACRACNESKGSLLLWTEWVPARPHSLVAKLEKCETGHGRGLWSGACDKCGYPRTARGAAPPSPETRDDLRDAALSEAEQAALVRLLDAYTATDLSDPDRPTLRRILARLSARAPTPHQYEPRDCGGACMVCGCGKSAHDGSGEAP